MSLVSVVISAYNVESFIAETVRSALGQTYRELEVVVIDDGSTDRTVEVAKAAGAGDSRLRVLTFPNGGPPVARNRGLAEAEGTYLAQLDGDDLWDATKLDRQIAVMEADAGVVAVGCFSRYVDAHGRPAPEWRFIRPVFGEEVSDPVRQQRVQRGELFPCQTSATVYRSAVMREVGGYDETLPGGWSDDLDILARVARQGRVEVIPEVLGSHRIHGRSISNGGALDNARSYQFVTGRLKAQAAGADLTWAEFDRMNPPRYHERRVAYAVARYQAARLQVLQRNFASAGASVLLALLAWPEFMVRFVASHASRWLRTSST